MLSADVTLSIKPTDLPPSTKTSNATRCVASKQDFYLYRGINASEYKNIYTELESKLNMHVATVSGYDIDGKKHYAALFVGKLSIGEQVHVWGMPNEAHFAHQNGLSKRASAPLG